MYTIANNQLVVSILDPISDRHRLGSRYCTGGYIYQVTDLNLGELFSGPLYPDPYPDVFDGQGAPDMFFTPLIAADTPVGGEVGCIGVGRVLRSSPREPFDVRFNPQVVEFLPWETRLEKAVIEMHTEQRFSTWGYELTRRVALEGREVISTTAIRSTGLSALPVRWFAHPFWPLTADQVLCRFTPQVRMADNPGYRFNDEGFICRKPDFDWSRGGHYQPLEILDPAPLDIIEKHPRCGQTVTRTDFIPGFLPIWGNSRTFSFEPYLIRSLEPGQASEWTISYRL
jgi:hypothetical protein